MEISRDLYFKNFAQFVKYKILKFFTSIRKIWSPAAIREIKILEMENEGPFVKYTTLENNHLYGSPQAPFSFPRGHSHIGARSNSDLECKRLPTLILIQPMFIWGIGAQFMTQTELNPCSWLEPVNTAHVYSKLLW